MKRIISFLIITCMAFSLSVFAEDDKGLTKALTFVKSVVDIPEEYNKFNYSTQEIDGIAYWSLYWSDKDYKLGSVSLSVDTDGNFLSYSNYKYNSKDPELAVLTKGEAKAKATEFLTKMLPNAANSLRESESTYNNYNDNSYTFDFLQYTNDIPVINNRCSLRVNKFTGDVENYNGFSIKEINYESSENTITEAEAKEKYLNDIGVTLSYTSNFDYKTERLTVYPVYIPNKVSINAISAIDGSVVDLKSTEYYTNESMDKAASMAAGGGNQSFTKEELEAIDKVSGLISKQQAEEKLKSVISHLPKETTLTEGSLGQDYIDKDKYVWNFSFKQDNKYTGSGSVDAKTGELLSFYLYSEFADATQVTKQQAQKKVEEFLEKIAPNKYKNSKLSENEPPIVRPLEKSADEPDIQDSYYFNYTRQANGIDYTDNGLYVNFDNKKGLITSYRSTWYDNAEFPSIDKVLGKSEIFDKIKDAVGYEKMYYEEKLVYNFSNNNMARFVPFTMMRFDPFTGEQLNYDGKPYEKTTLPVYEDISGHWIEDIALILLDNGIYKDTNQFKPDEYITQVEFLRFVLQWQSKGVDDDDFYESIIYQGYITEDEKNPSALVSRQDAAKIFTKILGHDEVAKYSDIFVYPFKDEVSQEYKGYITICNAFGIVSGDMEGNFNGDNSITNAETAAMIYNMKTRAK